MIEKKYSSLNFRTFNFAQIIKKWLFGLFVVMIHRFIYIEHAIDMICMSTPKRFSPKPVVLMEDDFKHLDYGLSLFEFVSRSIHVSFNF